MQDRNILTDGLTGPIKATTSAFSKFTDYPGEDQNWGIVEGDDDFTAFIKRFRGDPIGFARTVLHFDPLPWQQELMLEILKGTRQISVRSGHGTGKSTCVSIIAIWLLVCGHEGDFKCVITANTQTQMKDGIFAEVVKWFRNAPQVIQDLFEIQSERIYLKASPATVFLTARVASQNTPESLSGLHAARVFVAIDEASAVPDKVMENARGSLSSEGAQCIAISNPTRQSGWFYQTHHELSGVWKTMHVSCADNPLVSEEFRNELSIFGEDDPQYQIRYLGNFAKHDDNTLIPAYLVDAAMERDIDEDPSADLIFGLDVARQGGDATCLVMRRGNVILDPIRTWKGKDLMETCGIVANEARIHKPAVICVDSIGMGQGVADRLRELGFNVRDVNVAESSAFNPQASRLRDELWIALRDFLARKACRLPFDQQLRLELVAPRLEFLSNGKMKVEGKDSLRKRLKGASPDHADALCLTFAADAAAIGGTAPRWLKGQPLKRYLGAVI